VRRASCGTELRPKPHSVRPGETAVELRHDGQFIGTITGAEGTGICFLTKHGIEAGAVDDDGQVKVLPVVIVPAATGNGT
jgi:hypothetical protein